MSRRLRSYSDREDRTAFLLEVTEYATRESAASKRARKNPSKQKQQFEHAERKQEWTPKLERRVAGTLEDIFTLPRGLPREALARIHFLQYLELRASISRRAFYQLAKRRACGYRNAICSLYWLPIKAKALEGMEEVLFTCDEDARRAHVKGYMVLVYRRLRSFRATIRKEIRALSKKYGNCVPLIRHSESAVREALILCRGAEVDAKHLFSGPAVLPASRFDCTPKSLEYVLSIRHSSHELQSLFGESAGILDSGLFEPDFDALLDNGDWRTTGLESRSEAEHGVKKKYEWVSFLQPCRTFRDLLLPSNTKLDIEALVRHYLMREKQESPEGLTFLFRGDPGTGKSMTAEAIASALGMNILRVNFSEVRAERVSNMVTFFVSRAERTRSLLLFEECENIFRTNLFRGTSDGWAKVLFEKFRGVAVFTTNFDLEFGMVRRMNYVHEFEPESPELRQRILAQEIKHRAGEEGRQALLEQKDLLNLVTAHQVPGGYFQSILKLASARSPEGQLNLEALEHAFSQKAKSMKTPKNGIESPKISLADVVMRPSQRELVRRIIELAQSNRSAHPLLPKCVSAIFHGPPGTGKTLAAEAIAHELGKRIYKATAADLLSMYVGESEKAIRRLFNKATEEGFLLFIDEAEGLFRDRSAAFRSWELTQVNELLRQFDEFEGVVLLASNHKDAMDPAFARRIQFHVEFPIPSPTERRELWRKFFTISRMPHEESDIELLSDGFSLSGGEIRNAVIQAQAHGIREIQPLCEICRGIERQRFGSTNRKMGFQPSE